MKLFTLFSGIGSPEQGAYRVYGKENVELVGACEIDKFARESFKANYEIEDEHFHKDVTLLNGTEYKNKVDMLVFGSPCQSFSLAGLRKGTSEKRGQLIYEGLRIVDEMKPPIIIYENVKGIMSIDNGKTIKDFIQALRDIGYHCHFDILNTKDYEVPQNRERFFLVGFLDINTYYSFSFAPKVKLTTFLQDILEDEVDEKYFLTEATIKSVQKIINKKRGYARFITKDEKYAKTLTARMYASYNADFIKIDNSIKWFTYPKGNNKGGWKDLSISSTVTTSSFEQNNFIFADRIRKITPRECLRLQDFPDNFIQVVSNSQMYKQVGNSMSVNILEMIFNQIEKAKKGEVVEGSLF